MGDDINCHLLALDKGNVHVWEDKLCPWHARLDVLLALTAPSSPHFAVPAIHAQVIDSGREPWLEQDVHNYAHLLHVTVPRSPALLAVKATLVDLTAYSSAYVLNQMMAHRSRLPRRQLLYQAAQAPCRAVKRLVKAHTSSPAWHPLCIAAAFF